MKLALTTFSVLLGLQLNAFADQPRVIKVGEQPESVCRGFDNKLFVTIIGGDEAGDGGINVIDGDKVKELPGSCKIHGPESYRPVDGKTDELPKSISSCEADGLPERSTQQRVRKASSTVSKSL